MLRKALLRLIFIFFSSFIIIFNLPLDSISSKGLAPVDKPDKDLAILQLETEVYTLKKALNQFRDSSLYIVVDTIHNRLQIRQENRILREAICATGSGKVLLGPKEKNRWHFETPKHVFHIQDKVENPIWAKPNWAFVEHGLPVPILPWNFDRLDLTTLGKYALKLGDGYEIHGTIYPNLLGKHITHGCIRLNDDDLELTYTLIETGNRVYIY